MPCKSHQAFSVLHIPYFYGVVPTCAGDNRHGIGGEDIRGAACLVLKGVVVPFDAIDRLCVALESLNSLVLLRRPQIDHIIV